MSAITIYGGPEQLFTRCYPPVIQVRRSWADDWEFFPELELESVELQTCNQGASSCTFRRRYGGAVKVPWESVIGEKDALADGTGWWVRAGIATDQGYVPVFTGQIRGDGDDKHGAAAHGPSGIQAWVAYGPLDLLRRTSISTSFWSVEAAALELGWIPDVNDRDGLGWVSGNRTEEKVGDSYLFYGAGASVWTAYDFLEYLVVRHLDDPDGVRWTLSGQLEPLREIEPEIRLGTTITAADAIKKVIATNLGLDWRIEPTEDGFEIVVFSVLPEEIRYCGKSIPANADCVDMVTGRSVASFRTRVGSSGEHAYGTLRVVGKRIVSCFSLYGISAASPDASVAGTLCGVWADDIETEYKAGSGTPEDPPEAHDAARKRDRFAAVYQRFGASGSFDFHGGRALPCLDEEGSLVPKDDVRWEEPAYQYVARKTLAWIPLLAGMDYTTKTPSSLNPDGIDGDYLPPQAWLGSGTIPGWSDEPDYCPAETAGVGISVLQTDWGLQLSASPNHFLGLNHFSPGSSDAEAASEHWPSYDHDKLIVTLAVETDQRIGFEVKIPDAKPEDGRLTIAVDDAECWFLAPWTVVGIGPDYQPQYSPSQGVLLRADTERILLAAAGAIARYTVGRVKAQIDAKTLLPWGGLLGYTLRAVGDDGDRQNAGCPITAISWTVDDKQGTGTTSLKAGYAL